MAAWLLALSELLVSGLLLSGQTYEPPPGPNSDIDDPSTSILPGQTHGSPPGPNTGAPPDADILLTSNFPGQTRGSSPGPTPDAPPETDTMLTSIRAAIEDLKDTMVSDQVAQDVNIATLERVDVLHRQVLDFASNLFILNNKFDTGMERILQMVEVVATATATNSRDLATLRGKLDQLSVATNRSCSERTAEAEDSREPGSGNSVTAQSATVEEVAREKSMGPTDKLMILGLAHLTRENRAASTAISLLSKRIIALEKYMSPDDGALTNATKVIADNFKKMNIRMGRLSRRERVLHRAVMDLLGHQNNITKQIGRAMSQKQNRIVVETNPTALPLLDSDTFCLSSNYRINFTKTFTETPEVYASLSGFAMDTHHPSLKSGVYSFYLRGISGIDTSGFSVEVIVCKEPNYSVSKWVQLRWIAIGV